MFKTAHETTSSIFEITDCFCFTKKIKEKQSFLNPFKKLSVIQLIVTINQPVKKLVVVTRL